MSDSRCLIVDDVACALTTMSVLGRCVASDASQAIREAVRKYAARRGWVVVQHDSFVDWAAGAIREDPLSWVILDPLFPRAKLPNNACHFRLSRRYHHNVTILRSSEVFDDASTAFELTGERQRLGILDDAVGSGRTLRHMIGLADRKGMHVAAIAACASSRAGRESIQAAHPGLRWSAQFVGDWSTIHLRDGCPYLPYSGVPTGNSVTDAAGMNPVQLRMPSSAVLGHPWQVLCMDSGVAAALSHARSDIPRRLSDELGRPAQICDLPLLGEHVPAPVPVDNSVTHDTALSDLVV